MAAAVIARAIRAVSAWVARQDIAYLESYLAACAAQPSPDEALLRQIRGQLSQAWCRLIELEHA
jgi:hypothetical protein